MFFINYFCLYNIWWQNCARQDCPKVWSLPRSDRLRVEGRERGEERSHRRIMASDTICLSDPLMRIFLRKRNFHNFLVRRYFEKFCGAAFHLLYRNFVISLNSKHEITRVLRGFRHSDSIWENVMLSERKLAVRETTTLDSREWRSSNLRQYNVTRARSKKRLWNE